MKIVSRNTKNNTNQLCIHIYTYAYKNQIKNLSARLAGTNLWKPSNVLTLHLIYNFIKLSSVIKLSVATELRATGTEQVDNNLKYSFISRATPDVRELLYINNSKCHENDAEENKRLIEPRRVRIYAFTHLCVSWSELR